MKTINRAWQPVAEASELPVDATGVSGPCAVLLSIDVAREGPFIRQARFDLCAKAFVCDSTGSVLHDAVSFIQPYATHAASRPADGDWVMVPREPTQPMRDAGNKAIRMCETEPGMGVADRAFYAYMAMVGVIPDRVIDGAPANDREALLYLMQQFDAEVWNCERCGHAEETSTMDSAHFLREYLASAPTSAKAADPLCPKHGHMYATGCADCSADIDMLSKESPTPDAAVRASGDWQKVTEAVAEYVEDYELRGEDEQGRDGCYTPNETERFMLTDCINGLLDDDQFQEAFAAVLTTPSDAGGEAVAYRVPIPSEPDLGHWYEDAGEVTHPEADTHTPLFTTPPNPGDARPKYAVGDRVTWTNRYGTSFPGTIEECSYGPIRYCVALDDGTIAGVAYERELLSLLDGKGVAP